MKIDYKNNIYDIDDSVSWRVNPILSSNQIVFGSIFDIPLPIELNGCVFIECSFENIELPGGNEFI